MAFPDMPFDHAREADTVQGAPARRPSDWPLIGDIVSHRAGVPDHLIRWCRAEGRDDPAPTP